MECFFDYLDENFPTLTQKYDKERFSKIMFEMKQLHPEIAHDFSLLRKRVSWWVIRLRLLQLYEINAYCQALRHCAEDVGINPDDVVDPAFKIFVDARSKPDLYDDVSETLLQLKEQGFKLGAITNGRFDIRGNTHKHITYV